MNALGSKDAEGWAEALKELERVASAHNSVAAWRPGRSGDEEGDEERSTSSIHPDVGAFLTQRLQRKERRAEHARAISALFESKTYAGVASRWLACADDRAFRNVVSCGQHALLRRMCRLLGSARFAARLPRGIIAAAASAGSSECLDILTDVIHMARGLPGGTRDFSAEISWMNRRLEDAFSAAGVDSGLVRDAWELGAGDAAAQAQACALARSVPCVTSSPSVEAHAACAARVLSGSAVFAQVGALGLSAGLRDVVRVAEGVSRGASRRYEVDSAVMAATRVSALVQLLPEDDLAAHAAFEAREFVRRAGVTWAAMVLAASAGDAEVVRIGLRSPPPSAEGAQERFAQLFAEACAGGATDVAQLIAVSAFGSVEKLPEEAIHGAIVLSAERGWATSLCYIAAIVQEDEPGANAEPIAEARRVVLGGAPGARRRSRELMSVMLENLDLIGM